MIDHRKQASLEFRLDGLKTSKKQAGKQAGKQAKLSQN